MPTELADFDPQQWPPTSPSLPPLTLSWLDRRALHFGFSADEPQLVALDQAVLQTARALAGTERAEARLAMTAKALDVARAKLLILEALLDEPITAADEKGVRRLSRVVEGARRHFVALLAEHRHACDRRQPVKITVGQADAVNVMAVGAGRRWGRGCPSQHRGYPLPRCGASSRRGSTAGSRPLASNTVAWLPTSRSSPCPRTAA